VSYETFFSGFLVLFSIAALFMTKDFPGAAAPVPIIALVLTGVMAAHAFYRSLHRATPVAASERVDIKRDFNLKVILAILFFLSFSYVSYLITAPLFIILISRMCGVSWKNSVLSSVVASGIVYVVFIVWLQVYIEI